MAEKKLRPGIECESRVEILSITRYPSRCDFSEEIESRRSVFLEKLKIRYALLSEEGACCDSVLEGKTPTSLRMMTGNAFLLTDIPSSTSISN